MEPRRHVLGPLTLPRVGFGARQLPGTGVFGPPPDRAAAVAVLRRTVGPGVDQNLLNLADRRSMPVLEECQARGIAFVPFFPPDSGFANGGNPVQAGPAAATAADPWSARPLGWRWPGCWTCGQRST